MASNLRFRWHALKANTEGVAHSSRIFAQFVVSTKAEDLHLMNGR
jgi:hypothetical protein